MGGEAGGGVGEKEDYEEGGGTGGAGGIVREIWNFLEGKHVPTTTPSSDKNKKKLAFAESER